jgi:hypothetical protein
MSPRFALAWGLAGSLGCGAADSGRLPSAAIGQSSNEEAQPKGDVKAQAGELPKSDKRLAGGVSGARKLGTDLEYIAGLTALEGVAAAPEWGAASVGPELARDDDILTAWTCDPADGSRCAIGLSFPEPVELHSVRIYAAAGPDWKAYNAHPRLQTIRLHTDAGADTAEIDDGAGHRYVFLGRPAKTKTVTVEIINTRGGNSGPIHVNEIEAFGKGTARAPLELDPSRAYVNFVNGDWKKYDDGQHIVRQAFLEFDREGGAPLRFMRGTAIYGQPGDRFLLIERLHKTSCDFNSGSYVLLDSQRRTYFPLGPLGGVPGLVFRNEDGMGFAVGHGELWDLRGIVFDGKAVQVKSYPKNARDKPLDYMDAWNMKPNALPRGGSKWNEPPANCSAASDAERQLVEAQLGSAAAGELLHCNLAEGAAAISKSGVAVVDAAGEIVASYKFGSTGIYFPRLRTSGLERDGDVEMVVETRGADGESLVMRVHAKGIAPLEEDTSLALRPPHSCKRAKGFGTKRAPATAGAETPDAD